ncbi:MAG TPA: YciI family protein [Woeseiaceae bacterium]|nr:YciI family protein [Woeseiaceae bacterium]
MKYLCLAWEEEAVLDALSREEWGVVRRETLDFVAELRESGQLLAAEPLQRARNGVALRRRGGSLSVMDGPFTETKEQLGGIFLIEAADLNEAIQIASRWPPLGLSTVEVRPVDATLRTDRRYEEVGPP